MFAVFSCDSGYHTPRLGLSTAARIVGGSVRRNRIKRLVRESFRQHQHELPNVDIVVNARAGVCNAGNDSIRRSLERHWQMIGRRCAPS
jgi:ribonuclease P protein component